ncbi:MAG: ABC transporter permease [Puia sp.]|nr:ABC transporter permease [Puia sp.]
MLKNYFVLAGRNFKANKVFTGINVLGLSVALSTVLVIYVLVHFHHHFDKFEKDGDRIYRVVSNFTNSGETYHSSGILSPLGRAIRTDLAGIEEAAPFRLWDRDLKISIPSGGQKDPVVFKKQKSFIFADLSFFHFLGYQWLAGVPATALNQPYQLVLTEDKAKLYFPGLTPSESIGRQLYFNDSLTMTVTGIVRDLDRHTDFTFKAFVSEITLTSPSLQPDDWTSWTSTDPASQLLIKLTPGSRPAGIEKEIYTLYEKNHGADDNGKKAYVLQPLSDIHFNGDYGAYGLPVANRPTLYSLLAIAAFLLIMGCINFINLSTARSTRRAKEIGVRKAMGSSKTRIMLQFLSETFLLTLMAIFLSLCFIPFILKAFSDFIPQELHFSEIGQPAIVLFVIGLVIVVPLLCGIYPGLILSRFNPATVLQNQAHTGDGKGRHSWVRKFLTISQFTIAQFFVLAIILVGKQMNYSLNKDMGFRKEAVICFNFGHLPAVPIHGTALADTATTHKAVPDNTGRSNKTALVNRLKAMPEIETVSLANNPPSSDRNRIGALKYVDEKEETEAQVYVKYADTNYIGLYHLKLLAGANLENSDTVKGLILNETYARMLHFKDPREAIGKQIQWEGRNTPVVGVVADFNQRSFHEPIKPLIISTKYSEEDLVSVALRPRDRTAPNWTAAIDKMRAAFKQLYPEDDFDYHFFDENISRYYENEQRLSRLLVWTTGIAVFICCLGLLGLVIYTTHQRMREIGIRKVLGASVPHIITLLSKDFLLLVIIAFVIATPIAWIFMNKWLQHFVDRTAISWWIFVLGGLLMIIISLCTLGFQTVRAAMANPVRSLRAE